MESLDSVTRAEAVVAQVRDEIVRGERAPGSPLRESALCSAFGISRVTAREALRKLADEGLVELYPHRGAFVIHLDLRMAWEYHTVRALLEPYALRLAMEQRAFSEKMLRDLDALADEQSALERRGEAYGALDLEVQFHNRLCVPSDHRVLLQVVQNIAPKTMMYLLHLNLLGYRLGQDAITHRDIVAAIRAGDAKAAEESVRSHIREAIDLIELHMDRVKA